MSSLLFLLFSDYSEAVWFLSLCSSSSWYLSIYNFYCFYLTLSGVIKMLEVEDWNDCFEGGLECII